MNHPATPNPGLLPAVERAEVHSQMAEIAKMKLVDPDEGGPAWIQVLAYPFHAVMYHAWNGSSREQLKASLMHLSGHALRWVQQLNDEEADELEKREAENNEAL